MQEGSHVWDLSCSMQDLVRCSGVESGTVVLAPGPPMFSVLKNQDSQGKREGQREGQSCKIGEIKQNISTGIINLRL